MSERRIFIPESLISVFPEDLQRKFVALDWNGYIIRGFLVPKKRAVAFTKTLNEWEGWGPFQTGIALGGNAYEIWSNSGLVSTKHYQIKETAEFTRVVDILETELRDLSSACGYEIHLNLFNEIIPHIPDPRNERSVTIFYGAYHPGESRSIYRQELCGFTFAPGDGVRYKSASEGIGTIIRDDDDNEIAQIIDGNIYILLPFLSMLSCINKPFAHEIFKRAWNGYVGHMFHTDKVNIPCDEAKFVALLAFLEVTRFAELEVSRVEIDTKIASLEKELEDLYRERGLMTRILRDPKNEIKEDMAKWTLQWQELQKISGIESMHHVSNGVHFILRPIEFEYDGKNYNFGTFHVRIGIHELTGLREHIWSPKPVHEKGIFHPHISIFGNACYGNISQSMRKARSDLDIVSLVTLILRWLTEGYDPSVADHPIEEWPLVQVEGVLAHAA